MHRKPLLGVLGRYLNRHPCEVAVTRRMIDFVAADARCLERSLEVGHVTASAWIVDAAGQSVVLTHHRKLGRWLQLGGHADGDPDTLSVARREAVEESGLRRLAPISDEIFDLDIHAIPARPGEPAHFHYDVRYAFTAMGGEALVVNDESHDLAWVPIADLESLTDDPSLLRMAAKWSARDAGAESMKIDVPQEAYRAIESEITSADSPVGIDAKKTHVIILYKLLEIERRLAALEKR